MDIDTLDTRGMAETAQFLHLKDPNSGKLMVDGETKIGVMVKGSHARSVQAKLAVYAKENQASLRDTLRQSLEESHADEVKSAVAATDAIIGVTKGGQALTEPDFAVFYDKTFKDVNYKPGGKKPGSFAQQVMAFSEGMSRSFTLA